MLHSHIVSISFNVGFQSSVGSYWWLNQSVPESFSFAQLDRTYNQDYFDFGGHPDRPEYVQTYVTLVDQLTRLFFRDGRPITSLVEFGNGGGYFAQGFAARPYADFVTVEGSGAGVATTLQRYNIPSDQVVQHDLRLPLYLGRRFDVAVCSEVVEHVEPPFAAQVVLTLVLHSNVIWFSVSGLNCFRASYAVGKTQDLFHKVSLYDALLPVQDGFAQP